MYIHIFNAIIFFDVKTFYKVLILLKLSQIKYLLQVVNCGSITTAAKNLGINRTTLLMSLDSLEEEIGTTILQREKTGTTLTAEGIRLSSIFEEMQTEINKIELLRQNWLLKKQLRIYSDSAVLLPLLNHINTAYINSQNNNETLLSIATPEEADLIFSVKPFRHSSEEYDIFQIFDSPYCICMRNSHPLASKKVIDLNIEELSYPIFLFSDEPLNNYAYPTINNLSSLQRIILVNDYLALIPEIYLTNFLSLSKKQTCSLKISDENLFFKVFVYVRKNVLEYNTITNYLNYLFSLPRGGNYC